MNYLQKQKLIVDNWIGHVSVAMNCMFVREAGQNRLRMTGIKTF